MTVLVINKYSQLHVHILQLNFSEENITLRETGLTLKTWGYFNSRTSLLGRSNVANQCCTVNLKASFSCQKPLKSKIQKHMIYWNTELIFLKIWLKGLKTARLPWFVRKHFLHTADPAWATPAPCQTRSKGSFLFPFPFSTGKALGTRVRPSYE